MSNQYFDQADSQDNRAIGILMAIFPILFFLPFIAGNLKNSTYLRFRANQCCIILLLSIVSNILSRIPLVGWIIGLVLGIVLFVLSIVNIVYAATEQTEGKPLPVIGVIEIIK